MKKQIKMLYMLAATVGVSIVMAKGASADADITAKAYPTQAVIRPQPLVNAPQPVYVKEAANPQGNVAEEAQPEVIYHSAPTEPMAHPVMSVPQPIYLSSPVPAPILDKQPNKGCGCKSCKCNQPTYVPPAPIRTIVAPMPVVTPCQTGNCPQVQPVVTPCQTGNCPQVQPVVTPCQTGNCPQVQPVVASAPVENTCPNGKCSHVPPSNKDGSLFPGGECSHCTDGKKESCKDGGCVPPANKDGSLFPGGKCRNCSESKKAEAPAPAPAPAPTPCPTCMQEQLGLYNYVPAVPFYQPLQHRCCDMASIGLDHVDFRIQDRFPNGTYSNRIGQYRFRIFGCRRMSKDVRLNSERVLEKNINFTKYFEDAVKSCYKVVPAPKDLCLQAVPSELPEYLLTAEITDYYMNVCDEFDWDKVKKKDQRSGNSEITVRWRLTDLTKNTVYWKGETLGYGEIYDGEPDGEIKLIERAFADAASNLRAMTGFEDQLMMRVPDQTISAQRYAIIEEERALNPIKCGYRKEYECASSCVITGPDSDISKCQPTCGCMGTCPQTQVVPAPMMAKTICTTVNEEGMEVQVPCETGCTVVNEEGVTVPAPCETGGVEVQVEPVEVKTPCEAGSVVINAEGKEVPCETGAITVEPVQVTAQTCYDEQGHFVESATCKIVDDTWIDTGDVKALDTLCVTTTDPCRQLTPETMYRLRSSVVQIESPNGNKGAGLLISDNFVLTSGDLVGDTSKNYKVKTIRNKEIEARAVRINPNKNTALLMLDENIEYTPLALNLNLPEVNSNGFLTLGLLDVKDFKDGEDYLENSAKIAGYRYTEGKGAEILANTFIQNVTVGGALFYKDCTVNGMAHSGIKTDDGLDVYLPTETALRSLGISICNHEYVAESPWQQTVYRPVTQQIQVVPQAPEVMAPKDRK